MAKKAEAKELLEKEMTALKPAKVNLPSSKVTRAQISTQLNSAKKESEVKKEKVVTHLDTPLEENINRLTTDGAEARTIDEAIEILRWLIQV